jgi:hypothetical protein
MRTTVRLPEELLRRAKRKAAAQGVTLTALIAEGLRAVVNEREKPRRRRVQIPVSKATGGLAPELKGVDPAKLASVLEEIDDLEYIERMKRFK